MEIIQSLVLGIVQGLTEFLPISSSGHLAIVQALFQYESTGLVFEVFVHFGTVMSVIVAFRKDLQDMLSALYRGIIQPGQWKHLWEEDDQFRWNWLILIGIIPAGVAGLLMEDMVDQAFQDPLLVGVMLLVTAMILWSSRIPKQLNSTSVGIGKSILIGCAQALAIIPGISRSGSTITAGIWLKISPEVAAKFSFFLAIPVILGASVLEFFSVLQANLSAIELWGVIVGTIAAFLSGWAAILFLMDILRRGKFSWFAIYCSIIGVFTIAITII